MLAKNGGVIVFVLVVGFLALAAYSVWYMFFKVGK